MGDLIVWMRFRIDEGVFADEREARNRIADIIAAARPHFAPAGKGWGTYRDASNEQLVRVMALDIDLQAWPREL